MILAIKSTTPLCWSRTMKTTSCNLVLPTTKRRCVDQLERTRESAVEFIKMGNDKTTKLLSVTSHEKQYTVAFVLQETLEVLGEQVIEINNPIQSRGVTLVYDAKVFAT